MQTKASISPKRRGSFPQAHTSLECLLTNYEAGHIAGILYFYLFFEWYWVWACFPDWFRTRECQGSSCLTLLSDGYLSISRYLYTSISTFIPTHSSASVSSGRKNSEERKLRRRDKFIYLPGSICESLLVVKCLFSYRTVMTPFVISL